MRSRKLKRKKNASKKQISTILAKKEKDLKNDNIRLMSHMSFLEQNLVRVVEIDWVDTADNMFALFCD
jgi:hypothetical protein